MLDAQNLIARIRATGNTPDASYIAKRCGITQEEAHELLQMDSQVVPASIPKVRQSRVKQYPQGAKPDSPAPIPKAVPIVQEPAKDPKSLRERVQGLLLAVLPFVFAGASIAGSIRSYTLCYGYFVRFNDHMDAMMLAIMLVATAFATPQAVPILWDSFKHGKRIVMFFMAVLISVGTIGTNVLITATELGNQKTETFSSSAESVERRTQIDRRITALEARGSDLRELLDIDKEERKLLLQSQGKYEVGTYEYNRVRNNLADSKNRIDLGSGELSTIENEIDSLRKELGLIPVDLAGSTMTDIDRVIMYMSAGLIEAAAPLSLSIALFL